MNERKTQLIEESKGYFQRYPKVNTFYVTKDGMFFTPENRSDGADHARKINSDLIAISRNDIELPTLSQVMTFGEDAPSAKWTVDELRKYMDGKGISYEAKDTKKVLFEKIRAYKEVTPDETWSREMLISYLAAQEIPFEESDSEEVMLAKIQKFISDSNAQ